MRKADFDYHCAMPWTDWTNNLYIWNTVGAEAIELFGLPGTRYITDIGENALIYSFKDSKDAVLFKLKFGEITT